MKYSGRLSKTIAQRRIGILESEDVYQTEAKRITDEIFSKFPELFVAHGVPDGNWFLLALELAKAHVPGFKVVKPAGRKTEWSIVDKAEFRLDVGTLVDKDSLSVVEAIKLVIRLDAWATKTAPMTVAALEQHYYNADLRFVEIVKNARAWQALPPSVRDSYE